MNDGGSVNVLTLVLLAGIGVLSIANVVLALSFRKVQREVEKLCAKAKENLDQSREINRRNSNFRSALERLARRHKDL
jgi:cell division protein FtsB